MSTTSTAATMPHLHEVPHDDPHGGGEVPGPVRLVVVGVDTHRDTHHAAVVDGVGRVLGSRQFTADGAGYAQLLAWAQSFGQIERCGVEGTGTYGAGLTRFLLAGGVEVVEVNRPDRSARRRVGKSDPVDAEAAARAALSGRAAGAPKDRTGVVEAIRVLRVARRSAVAQQRQVGNQLRGLVVTAPEELAVRLRGMTMFQLATTAAAFRPAGDLGDPTTATKTAMRRLARRWFALKAEAAEANADLTVLVGRIAPRLLAVNGVGVDAAGQLLVTAGQNAARITSEAAFARLIGVAPQPASSGRTDKHRLSRSGDRQAHAALHRVVLSRMRHDPVTQAYVARRVAQGLRKRDVIRCLQRYVARDLYRRLHEELMGRRRNEGVPGSAVSGCSDHTSRAVTPRSEPGQVVGASS